MRPGSVWQYHISCLCASYHFSDRQEALGATYSFELVSLCQVRDTKKSISTLSSAKMLFLVWYQEYSLQECLVKQDDSAKVQIKGAEFGHYPGVSSGGKVWHSHYYLGFFTSSAYISSNSDQTCPCRIIVIRILDSHHFCCTDPRQQQPRPDSPECGYWFSDAYISEDMWGKEEFIYSTNMGLHGDSDNFIQTRH